MILYPVLDPQKDLDQKVDLYNGTLIDLVARNAPLRSNQITHRDTICKKT